MLRGLAKDPGARFATARELQRALREVLGREAGPHHGCPRCGAATSPFVDRGGLARARPVPRAGFAQGSDAQAPAGTGETSAPRRAIARALVAGDVAAIAGGYAALAEALAREGRLADAIHELEEGIDVLTTGDADHAAEGHLLVMALAAVSERAGQARRARRLLAAVDARDTLPDLPRPEGPLP